ncbi:MAG TPA: response regulator transcription factor [Burkholderiaceae bacterium]|nr:response regulator transcription factor [Burkholderiaceae bacterium]
MAVGPGATELSVLLVDDDVELVRLLTQLFLREGIVMRSATTGTAGLDSLDSPPSLVLLDLMLPDMHGKEVFRRLRERLPELPVIMLTAKGDPVDRVIGLELGADDYVPKPCDPRERIARVRTVLRRSQPRKASAHTNPTATLLKFGKLVLDTGARTLTSESGEVPLTNIEFRLLLELVRHPGTALSRESLTRAAQVGNYRPLDRAVDVQIARLRRKLRQADDRAQWIGTARGEGYVWAPPALSNRDGRDE